MSIQSNFNAIAIAQFDHGYYERKKEDFQYPKHCQKLTEKSQIDMGKKICNRLPTYIIVEIITKIQEV